MRFNFFTVIIFAFISLTVSAQNKTQDFSKYASSLAKQQEIGFEENLGQIANDKGVAKDNFLFRINDNSTHLFITEWGLTYYFIHENESAVDDKPSFGWERLDMILDEATISKENIIKEKRSAAFSNYYYPHCPDGINNVYRYSKITIKDVYPNIDWVIYKKNNQLKYDFVVNPGGNPNDIRMKYKGVEDLNISNQKSSLILQGKKLQLKDEKLIVTSDRKKIKSSFIKNETLNSFSFKIEEDYDKNSPLIIDPVLTWSTYVGSPSGNNGDNGFDVTLDSNHVYLTGSVNSLSFPLLNPGGGAYYQATYGGGTGAAGDIPISKFTHAGILVWSTYYGGSSNESGYSIDMDNTNLYITGYTNSSNLPTQNPGGGAFFQGTFGGSFDGYILKFNLAGVRQWCTYYGGSAYDGFEDISILSGNVFVVGSTSSTNFPVQNPGGGAYYQGTNGGGQDGMIAKFSSTGVRQWSSYYGGNATDALSSVDNNGTNVFVAGYSASTNYPVQNPGGGAYYQATNGGSDDHTVLSFNGTNSSRIWATYLGGSGSENYPSLAVDATDVYVSGVTGSTNFPTLNPGGGAYFQGANGGSNDYVICKFNTSGVMSWSTYYGGAGNEFFGLSGGKVAVNSTNLYVSVRTFGSGVPLQTLTGSYNQAYAGNQESVLIEFDKTNNSRNWASYFGGSGLDIVWGIEANDSYLYGTGVTASTSAAGFPLVNPGGGAFYDNTYGSLNDTYLAQFTLCVSGTNTTPTTAICEMDTKALTNSGGTGGTWSVVSGGGSITGTTYTPANISADSIVTVRYTDECGGDSDIMFTVNASVSASNTTTSTAICEGDTKALIGTPSGGTWSIVSGPGSITGTTYNSVAVSGDSSIVIKYKVAGNGMCPADSANVTFVVNNNAPANNTTTIDSICETETKTLSATPSGGTWTLINGNGVITGSTYTPNDIATSEAVLISYDVAANGSCSASSDSVSFMVHPAPEAIITSSNADLCSGTFSVLIGTPLGGSWNLVSGTGTISNDTIFPTDTGVLVINYIVTNANGCSDTASQSVNSVSSPTDPAVSTGGNDTICLGESITINASGSGSGITYNVYSSAVGSSWLGVTPYTISPILTTTYYIDADNGTCMNSGGRQSIQIVVNPVPSVTITPSSTICPTEQITLVATGGGNYLWSTGSINDSIIVSPTNDSTYTVIVTNASGCSDTVNTTISVQSGSVASALNDEFIAISGNDTIINIVANDNGDANSIITLNGPYHGTGTITNGELTYTSDSNYFGMDTIQYSICDASCTSLCDTAFIYITVERDLFTPQFFSPGDDGLNDVFQIVGLEKYPNNELKIYNRWGNIVYKASPYNNDWDGESNITNAPVVSGTYYYILSLSDNEEPTSGFIQVKR